MLVPACGHEHGFAADAEAVERLGADRLVARASAVDQDPVEVDDSLQRQVGQVLPARELMGGRVDVGPRVRDKVDPPDLEGRARGVARRGRLVGQERRDRGWRYAGCVVMPSRISWLQSRHK